MNKMLSTAAVALLLAGPAFAQSPAAETAPAPGTEAGSTSGGMTMGTTSTMEMKYVTVSDADIMASRLEDLDVYNNEGEDIGEIEDLVIRDGQTITGVVVSVGGFLGLGDRYVLLDPSSVVLAEQDGGLRALVNTNKDDLGNAPEFEYTDND